MRISSTPPTHYRYDGTLLAHELELGRDYELIVTTLGGLCRYRIGDVVWLISQPRPRP